MIEIEDNAAKRSKEKRDIFDRLCKQGPVTLQFDARRAGVDVPEHLEKVPNLLIKMSPRYATYLHVDAERASQMLSFGELGDLPVSVPWSAVYAIHPGRQGADSAVWGFDVPSELRRAFGIDPSKLS